LLGNITVAYLTGLAFIFGGIAVNNVRGALIPAVFAFFINLIRELIKDMDDIEGDAKVGLQTFSKRFGTKATILLITFVTITLIASTFYPFIKDIYNIEFFVLAMLVVNPILVYFLKLLYEKDASKNLNKLSNMLKLNMVFGLLAIFLGK
jgi:geranylgeranylglycerol-phosphate geranylgeranyltransferase